MIRVSQEILSSMEQHALTDFPDECVGFFYGTCTADEKQITEYQPIHNSKEGDKRRRFEVSPIDYMKAEKYAMKQNVVLLGIYHSHPLHPAIPSEHDLKQAVPFFSYIISSVDEQRVNETTSWLLSDTENKFEQETVISIN